MVISLNVLLARLDSASAIAKGDGVILYGVAGNTTPQYRDYAGASNGFSAAGGAVVGSTPLTTVIRTSPVAHEAIAGYVDSSGTLQVMCFNGTTWSNEWSTPVGGGAASLTSRRFDISYETSSGDAVVLYANNGAITNNEMAYRTKPGGTGCGTSNWSNNTTLSAGRTNGSILWVKMAWDRRSSSDLITAIWADSSRDLSAMVWSGSAWGNEPSSALETALEIVSTAQDVQSFDVDYESLSGDVVIVWGQGGSGSANGAYYTTCTGGTASCTWNATLKNAISGLADDATNLDLAANPKSDELSFASIGNGGADLQAAYWSGSSWSATYPNIDTACETPTAGAQRVATAWVANNSVSRWVVTYDDSSGTGISYKYADGSGSMTSPIDFAPAAAVTLGDLRTWYNFEEDPLYPDRALVTISDSSGALYAKRIDMGATGSLAWSDAEGGSKLTTSNAQNTIGDFSYAYWRVPPVFDQSAYRWYGNADSVQPDTALANENTSTTITNHSAIMRLRLAMSVSGIDLDSSSQAFTLQYATSTSGPWYDVGYGGAGLEAGGSNNSWWSSAWHYRRRITFNNSASGTNLSNFPVLVVLNASNIDYSKVQSSGQDLRFVDTDGTQLPYEIEKWDSSGTSRVWVSVQQIDQGSSTDHIFMYYGNASASDAQNSSSVWSSYVGVWHLEETPPSSAVADETSTPSNGTTSGMSSGDQSPGQIDGSLTFGSGKSVNMGTGSKLNSGATNTRTIESWVKRSTTSGGGYIQAKGASGSRGYELSIGIGPCGANQIKATKYGVADICVGTVPSDTAWHKISVVWSSSGVVAYIDGVASSPTSSNTSNFNSAPSDNFYVGTGAGGSGQLDASLDELRVATSALSADWVKAEYLNDVNNFSLFSAEEIEAVGGGVWRFANNPSVSHGATITSTLLTGSTAKESYQEDNPTPLNPNAITATNVGEWDFALDPSDVCGGTYYFRMVQGDGTELNAYSVYPQIVVDLPLSAPTDKVMRHGAWFNNEVEQPYSCAWMR